MSPLYNLDTGKRKTTKADLQAAFRMADLLGLKLAHGPWGRMENDHYLADECLDACHEIAHFLVSPVHLRRVPYFGLGRPGLPYEKSRSRVSKLRADVLEAEAAVLGAVLCYEISGSLRTSRRELQSNDPAVLNVKTAIRNLKRKGFLETDLRQRFTAYLKDYYSE